MHFFSLGKERTMGEMIPLRPVQDILAKAEADLIECIEERNKYLLTKEEADSIVNDKGALVRTLGMIWYNGKRYFVIFVVYNYYAYYSHDELDRRNVKPLSPAAIFVDSDKKTIIKGEYGTEMNSLRTTLHNDCKRELYYDTGFSSLELYNRYHK
jgi:hypothetical protein